MLSRPPVGSSRADFLTQDVSMNDAERLLRGPHIVDLAGEFEKIDYAIERLHDLLKGSYYDLRKLAEHGRDEAKLALLRPQFDMHYLALRDVVSGYLRLEKAHDRLYELMGDDQVRAAEARRAAFRERKDLEQIKEDKEDARLRRGYRATMSAPPTESDAEPEEDGDVDATMMAGVSASDVEAAIEAARLTVETQAALAMATPIADGERARRARELENVLRERSAELTHARPAMTDGPAGAAGDDWDMPTMQVTAATIAAALKERGIE